MLRAEALTEIGFAQGGKAGAQLATRLAIPTSRDKRLAAHAPLRDLKAQDLADASAERF